MILFFGTRPGKKMEQRLHGVPCTYCGQMETLTAITQPNYFHMFWLPLFKIHTYRYAACSHCKKVYYKGEFTLEMEESMN